MRTRTVIIVAVCLLIGAAARPFALEQEGEAFDPIPWSFIPGEPLGLEECDAVVGGDVRMSLNQNRTKLKVNVIDNEYEARLGRIPPKEVYEFDVHNRVVNTTNAPFMPAKRAGRTLAASADVTTKPSEFPEGYWSVTAVKERSDKYGPYMISTNAVGDVDVYVSDGNGGKLCMGKYKDLGYALHSNTNSFNVSKSYGCIILKQEDATTLSRILKKDKEDNPKAVQKVLIRSRRRDLDR